MRVYKVVVRPAVICGLKTVALTEKTPGGAGGGRVEDAQFGWE